MPTPEEIEVADLFLSKAASDLAAVRALARDLTQDDDVVGLHAQQAVEKSLKAVVAARGLEIPRSHDLVLLIRMVTSDEQRLPETVRESGWLTPWAVTMRYDETATSLDREAGVRVAASALVWSRARVDAVRAGT